MRVLLINGSPKARFANSSYFLSLLKLGLGGHALQQVKLTGSAVYSQAFDAMAGADAVVFAMPVYVDTVPSRVLQFMEYVAGRRQNGGDGPKIYVVANCGFYEGAHCRLVFEQMRCWCSRAGLQWGGGLGLGAGEMLGWIRIAPVLGIAGAVLGWLLASVQLALEGLWSFPGALRYFNWTSPLVTVVVFVLFSLGLWRGLWRLRRCIRKGAVQADSYSGVTCCPRFLFVGFANLFWILRAAFHGVWPWRIYRRR